jgi:hypothetical protein
MRDSLMTHRCGSDHVKYVGDNPIARTVMLQCDKCEKNWIVKLVPRLSDKMREFIWNRCAAFRMETAPKFLRQYYESCLKKRKSG